MIIPTNPHVIVEIGGKRYDTWQEKGLIASVSVELTFDKTGEGAITVVDDELKFIDRHASAEGLSRAPGRFWMGFGDDPGPLLFTGTLARVEHSDGKSTLRFHDKSSDMKREKKARYHNKMSDVQILRKLATEDGLQFSGPDEADAGEVYDSIMQDAVTNWALARKVADRAGLHLYVRGDTLYAKRMMETGNSVTTLRYKSDFIMLRDFGLSYKLPENKHGRQRSVEVRARARGGQRLSGVDESGSRGATDVHVADDLPKHTLRAATNRAKARRSKRREYAFENNVRVLPVWTGRRIQLSDTVTLANLGSFFSGNYLTTEVRHEFKPGSLTQELALGRDIK